EQHKRTHRDGRVGGRWEQPAKADRSSLRPGGVSTHRPRRAAARCSKIQSTMAPGSGSSVLLDVAGRSLAGLAGVCGEVRRCSSRSALRGAGVSGGAKGGIGRASEDGTTVGVASSGEGSGRVSVGDAVGGGGAGGSGACSATGGGAGLANGRGAERRGASRLQPTTAAITGASTPPPMIAYTRLERGFERFASSHSRLRIVWIGGRRPGALER